MGYTREQMLAKPGEFSIRGSIIDIYPLDQTYPCRIELFDDEIDSLRLFDVETQRSIEKIEEVLISPTSEYVFQPEDFTRGIDKVENLLQKRLAVTKHEEDQADKYQ